MTMHKKVFQYPDGRLAFAEIAKGVKIEVVTISQLTGERQIAEELDIEVDDATFSAAQKNPGTFKVSGKKLVKIKKEKA